MALCHLPNISGDGIDERDHHLSFASNPMTKDEWMSTFGRIYGELAEAGLPRYGRSYPFAKC